MKYNQIHQGMYVVRTKELAWLRVLSGAICYVDGVAPNEIRVRVTDDCVPKGAVYYVPAQADDDYWYDVSELVMAANSCITPASHTDAFSSAVAANYRNFLGLGDVISPLSLDQAEGRICMLGEQTNSGVVFAKTGFFVVAHDDSGYVIAYQGFCDFKEDDEPRVLNLKVLNLNGTKRAFYPARDIVSACTAAYEEDCEKADEYVRQIREDTIVSSADSALSARNSRVSDMKLEAAVC